MTQKIERESTDRDAAPPPLLKRLSNALAHPEIYNAMQTALNKSPRARNIIAELLHTAETLYNAPHLEAVVKDIMPQGVSPL